jgi:hypothetical protein
MTRAFSEIRCLIARDIPDRHARLCVSRGVLPAASGATAQEYEPEAYIPQAPWSPLADDDVSALQSPATAQRACTVGLVKVSDRLLEQLRRAALESAQPRDLSRCIEDLCAEVPRPWNVVGAPARLTLGRNPPGLHTVTRDPTTGAFVGLHVDTFDCAYDEGRTQAGNRISVNVGCEARSFLFVPVSFKCLAAEVPRHAATSIVKEFLRADTSQTVIALRVEPGEAYIAPTESLIHDASSRSMRCDDVHVTGRGIFEPAA